MSVPCLYPVKEDSATGELPDEFDEWRSTPECDHPDCVEADYFARLYRGRGPAPLSRDERAEIVADRELVLDEFHGRQP